MKQYRVYPSKSRISAATIPISELDSTTKYELARFSKDLRLLHRLADDPDMHVRQTLVYNKNVTPEILQQLAKDPRRSVRIAVAACPKVSSDILDTLAHEKQGLIQSYVVKHHNTSKETLEYLADPANCKSLYTAEFAQSRLETHIN